MKVLKVRVPGKKITPKRSFLPKFLWLEPHQQHLSRDTGLSTELAGLAPPLPPHSCHLVTAQCRGRCIGIWLTFAYWANLLSTDPALRQTDFKLGGNRKPFANITVALGRCPRNG